MEILIVDDSAVIVEQLTLILREILPAATIHAASDRSTAFRVMVQVRPRIVFLDVRLGDGNGLVVLASARSVRPPPQVILVTALPRTDPQVQAALRDGAAHYLEKPLRRASVAGALAAVGLEPALG